MMINPRNSLYLFLAACRDSFSIAELCPCYPPWHGSRYFCAVTSPGKTKESFNKCGKKKSERKCTLNAETLLRTVIRAMTTIYYFLETHKRNEWYKILRAKPCYKWPFYSWGIMFAQRQLEAFEKMWDTVSQCIHLWPSHCLSHWGCNLSCNPSHFCLCFCRLRQSSGHDCSKIHLFIQKEDMNCG